MNSHWFSNKGQMLQALLAAVACLVGLVVAYYTLTEHDHSTVPLVFVIAIAAVVCFLLFFRRPQPTSAPSPSDVSAAAAELLKPQASPTTNYNSSFKRFSCRLGDAYTEQRSSTDRFKVTLHAITKNAVNEIDFQSDYVAEVEINRGGGLLYPGKYVKAISTNRFLIPVTADPFRAEVSAVFSFTFGEKHTIFFGLYLEHINPIAKEITAVYAELRGIATNF